MAVWIVHARPGQFRADGFGSFMVSTATAAEDAARVKAEKLVGVHDGSGAPSYFAQYNATQIIGVGSAFDGSNFVPDCAFQGASLVGPRSVNPIFSIAEVWPKLGRGGAFLGGPTWDPGQD